MSQSQSKKNECNTQDLRVFGRKLPKSWKNKGNFKESASCELIFEEIQYCKKSLDF